MAGQTYGLEHYQFTSIGQIFRNLTAEELAEHEFTNGEGKFGPNGVMMISRGNHPERLVDCKCYVDESFKNSIMEKDSIFGFEVPKQLTGVDSQILKPRNTWNDPTAYDTARKKLAGMFIDNFEAYAQDGPKQGDVIAVKYLYNVYNKLTNAGPHL